MKWTKEPPKLKGYYWAQIDFGAVPEVVEVEAQDCVWRMSGPISVTVKDFVLCGDEKMEEPEKARNARVSREQELIELGVPTEKEIVDNAKS